ncbi:lytic transglycosylase domain-containing protein, partial [Salmonella enterica]|nr:lytic transglycosylase domain-containing protein [Salmonella enterica]
FTVENLKKVFEGAINSIIDFIKHPVDHITNGAKQAYKKVEEKVSGLWDAAGDAVADLKNGTIKAFESAGEAIQGGRKAIVRGTETLLTKAVDTAKAAPQKAGEAIKSVIDSDVVETAKSGARYLEDTVGEGAVAAANTARLAGGNITGSDRSDVQKAADTYNDGKLNVKESNPDALGAKNLKRMEPLFKSLEKQYNLPEGALYSIAATESKGHADAVSPTGARGMFQFTGIAREEVGMSDSDAWDPEKSAVGAAKLLSKYLKQANGDWNEAVTAYNAGFGTINKWKKGERELTKENKEYAIKVNTHRARYLGGETYTPGAGSNASNIPSTNVTAGTQIDEGTGLAFTPGENPFEKGGLIDKIGEKLGVNDMADKFLSAPGMRHQVVQGTLAERAYGRGTTTTMGNVDPKNIPMPASIADIQQPTARIPMDGRTISDLGGSGAKPTMQLADNTVTLDSETKRIFARMTAILDRIEGHTKDAAKNQGATIKVSTPQPGVTKTVPLSIDDPLMNEYARVD